MFDKIQEEILYPSVTVVESSEVEAENDEDLIECLECEDLGKTCEDCFADSLQFQQD